jgi:hypothetical protein
MLEKWEIMTSWAIHAEMDKLARVPDEAVLVINPSQSEKAAFRAAQEKCTEVAIEANSIFETNPTSNLFILGLSCHSKIPVWGLLAKKILVTLGTDDPCLFRISVEEELIRLYEAFPRLTTDLNTPSTIRNWAECRDWPDVENQLRQATEKWAVLGTVKSI